MPTPTPTLVMYMTMTIGLLSFLQRLMRSAKTVSCTPTTLAH